MAEAPKEGPKEAAGKEPGDAPEAPIFQRLAYEQARARRGASGETRLGTRRGVLETLLGHSEKVFREMAR